MTLRASSLSLAALLALSIPALLTASRLSQPPVTPRALPVHGAWFEPADGGSFVTRTPGSAVRVDSTGATVRVAGAGGSADIRFRLKRSNTAARAKAEERIAGAGHYLKGSDTRKWRRDVQRYARVRWQDVYPGIDAVYHRRGSELEYDFEVAPGIDPEAIRVGVSGAQTASLNGAGELVLSTPAGELRQLAPIAYQERDGSRTEVPVRTVLHRTQDTWEMAFAVGDYDPSRKLIIDPVISYTRTFGGSDADGVTGITVDAEGNAYVIGSTLSANFPTVSPLQPALGGAGKRDVFVAKLNAAGTGFVYSTYLGGADEDTGAAIALAPGGGVWITGATESTDFPTQNPLTGVTGGDQDAFIARIAPDGASLDFSTRFGGSADDSGAAIVRDAEGVVHVAGTTESDDLPHPNGFQAARAGGTDAFLARIAADDTLAYGTYFGGEGDDAAASLGLALDNSEALCGTTYSASFPTTSGAFQRTRGGSSQFRDTWVARVRADGTGLIYSTYLAGLFDDTAFSLACETAGAVYVAGSTSSPNYPTTPGAFQTRGDNSLDGFLTKVAADGASLIYSTRLGGSANENLTGAAVTFDADGNALFAGSTGSADFPVLDPVQAQYGGGLTDVFVTQMNPTASVPIFSTFLGGSGDEAAFAMALGAGPSVFVAGSTTGAVTPGRIAATADNAFVTKISLPATDLEPPDQLLVRATAGRRIELTWRDNSDDEAAFEVERKPGLPQQAGDFTLLAAVAADAESYIDTTVEPLTAYSYRVRAVDGERQSEYSNVAGATTPSENTDGPQAPTNLVATPVDQTSVRLRWTDNSDNETGFRVERSSDNGKTYTEVQTLNANSTQTTETKLTHSTAYKYRVRAVNGNAFSNYSNVVTVNTFPVLESLELSATSIRGGQTIRGEVRVTGPAPVGGFPVALFSGNRKVAKPPRSVQVPHDLEVGGFNIKTRRVKGTKILTITARAGGVEKQVTIQVSGGGRR